MQIFLGPGDMAVATTIAAIRQGVNREVGIANRKAGPQDPITTDIVGVLGELAFARWANVCPDFTTHLRSGGCDATYLGYAVDVKATRSPAGVLYVDARPNKQPDLYVLVHVDYATANLLGWCWAHEVSMRSYSRVDGADRIRHAELNDMRRLFHLAPKGA